MRVAVLVLVAAVASTGALVSALRDTNSRAATQRGIEAYDSGRPADAVEPLELANTIVASPATRFNLGTARVASGDVEGGAALLTPLVEEPELRLDAVYNRGNGMLEAKRYDEAIADYIEVLKGAPARAEAKRNLEIALRRKQEQQEQQSGGGGRQPEQSSSTPPQQGQSDQPDTQQASQPPSRKGAPDIESLLRAVQQQEREELERMKRAKQGQRKVDW